MSPRNSQFSRDDIVDSAFELVREHGWQGFSVQAVAKAIGSSTMPIYSQFQNLRELEDAVVWKALELLKERLLVVRTGDKWIDHAISWVKFAEEERHLHSILWDGRNPELDISCGDSMQEFITGELAGYQLFDGLGRDEILMITLSRRLFVQRLATWLNKDPDFLKKKGVDAEDFIRRTSKALYEGFRMQFAAAPEGGDVKTDKPSSTSEATTAVRAAEMARPAAERICHDPYAAHFLSPFYLGLRRHRWLGRTYGWIRERICPGLRGGILARTRYIDECLTASLGGGIEQLVILGAGFDSRAYRLIGADSGVPVFEVDHPATQQVKVAKVKEFPGGVPRHVVFVPVDFCRDGLEAQLVAAGYDRRRKSLFIWEGVTYYLDAAAVDALLTFVARNSASGSSIVFDCFPRSVIDGTSRLREARNLRKRVARSGEPLRFGLDDDEIELYLKQRSFTQIRITGSAECKRRWFHGVNQSIAVSEIFRFVHATHYRG